MMLPDVVTEVTRDIAFILYMWYSDFNMAVWLLWFQSPNLICTNSYYSHMYISSPHSISLCSPNYMSANLYYVPIHQI